MPASADSALDAAVAPPAGALPETGGLTVRRVPNLRYRARPAAAPPAVVAAPPVAVDDLRAQVTHRREGAAPVTAWQLVAREDRREAGTFELSLAGRERPGAPVLDEARLCAASHGWSAGAGDLPSAPLRATGRLMRLRGASLGRLDGLLPWRAHAGVAASSPGYRAAPVAVAGAGADGIPLGRLGASVGAFAFGRWREVETGALDSLPRRLPSGAGGGATLELQAKPGGSFLAVGLGAQMHDLDGTQALSALQRLEWRLVTPRAALSLLEARGSRGWRSLASDRLSSGATRDDRLAAQWRFRRWHAESHATAAASSGDASLTASRNLCLGGSANLGRSAWFAGADFEWRETGSAPGAERRLALQTGRFDPAASTLLRLERAGMGRAEGATTMLSGQASVRLSSGLRGLFEPRANWRGGRLLQSGLGLGLTWTSPVSGLRVGATVAFAGPQDGHDGRTVREASVRLQFAPRGRDRCEIEVRRFEGMDGLEIGSSYDLRGRRYAREPRPGDGSAAAWTGTVRVTVSTADDSAGVADALISLDGRRFAFTTEDGTVEFEGVEPGVHVVGIEERSLPGGLRATQATQVFVTVERGEPAQPVRIEVARPARRVRL